jgi:hypothetical protein
MDEGGARTENVKEYLHEEEIFLVKERVIEEGFEARER